MSIDPERFFNELQDCLREARITRTRQYERFFDGLAPRLETAQLLERELDSRLARRFNAFDYLRTDELGLSRIVGDLLNPRGAHGQGPLFLRTLLDGLQEFDAPDDLNRTRVTLEKWIADDRRLDVYVDIDERHGLAIENKPWAGDQKNQVRDYLEWLKGQRSRFVLIYLSPRGDPPDEYSVRLSALKKLEGGRLFVIVPYHDHGDWEDKFDGFRTDYSLTRWMADCRKQCDVDKLRWFLREAGTWCEREFGEQAMTSAEMDTVSEFVGSSKQNMETALAVYDAWPRVRAAVCSDALQTIADNLRRESAFHDLQIETRYDERERQSKSHISIYRASWKTYGPDRHRTKIRLDNDGKGPEHWIFGVCSGIRASDLTADERVRRERLECEVKSAKLGRRGNYWPCFRFADEKYRKWGSLVPALWEECNAGGGEITKYFADKLRYVAEIAVPIVDDIDGA